MIFQETRLAGAFIIEPERIEDERRFFARTWCRRVFAERRPTFGKHSWLPPGAVAERVPDYFLLLTWNFEDEARKIERRNSPASYEF